MKDVMSVRLGPRGLRRLRALARRERKEVSTVARELMDCGWMFLTIREYCAGKRSLETLAAGLDVSLSEAIDILADLGVRSPMEYDDHLRGYASARELVAAGKRRGS